MYICTQLNSRPTFCTCIYALVYKFLFICESIGICLGYSLGRAIIENNNEIEVEQDLHIK